MGKKVLVAGTFDLIHAGHILFLSEAKKLAGEGGELVVIVARDKSVEKFKGHPPILPEEERLLIVRSLKPVDRAILGDPEDPLKLVEKENPDLIVLGYDQWPDEEWLKKELASRGVRAKVIRLGRFEMSISSTREIIRKAAELVRSLNKSGRLGTYSEG